jgi:aminomethyltransferase
VHRISATHYFLCVNAANADKDFRWILDNSGSRDAKIENISDATAQLAIQGKYAEPLLQKISDVPLNDLKYYHFKTGKIHQIDGLICRTGYTGEDGFEIYFNAAHAEPVFREILEAGREFDLRPIGLGARDTLRLEMGYALYGNEIDAKTSPIEAGLGWVIKFDKGAFVGRDALWKQKETGPARKLTALRLLDRGVPRSHYPIKRNERIVGEITSGTFSPSLNAGIGVGYVARECSEAGTRLQVEIRNQTVEAEVVKLPFVPSHVKK